MAKILQFPTRKPTGKFLDLGGYLPREVIVDGALWAYNVEYGVHTPVSFEKRA